MPNLPRFYNTLLHRQADFAPLAPGPNPADPLAGSTITMYTCGPTVYDFAHIGNFRAFLFADILRRYLEFRGGTVRQVMNMTDVGHMTNDTEADATGEDKIIQAIENAKTKTDSGSIQSGMKLPGKKSGVAIVDDPNDPYQVVQFFVDAFLEDARALRVAVVQDYDAAPPTRTQNSELRTQNSIMPRPTQFIPPFINMIQTLLAKNHAYVGSDGVVYYSVASFPNYGKLSGNTIDQLKSGAGGRTAEGAAKRHPADFFLWKPDARHIMKWPSPWGEGYPGWHIECSAMATALLGESIDLHTGGEDNIFPHHECEIAQSEGATDKPFAHFWMHTRHLMVNGEKMSKSKGNFFTIRDLVTMGYDPLVVRFALINSRYRESMNFTLQGLHEAASAVAGLRDLGEKLLASVGTSGESSALAAADHTMLDEFTRAMDDDLNVAGALAAIFTWSAPLSKQKKLPAPQAVSALTALKKVDHVLDVIFAPLRPLDPATVTQVESLLAQRTAARLAKDWPLGDQLRAQLTALGVEIKDTPAGSTWRPRLAPATPPA